MPDPTTGQPYPWEAYYSDPAYAAAAKSMADAFSGQMGLPTSGVLLDPQYYQTFFDVSKFTPSLAAQMASDQYNTQYNAQVQQQIAAAQMGASTANAATQANATLGAAGIGANASIQNQLTQTKGQLASVNAQVQNDYQMALMGDQNATNRYNAGLKMQASLANQAAKLEISKLAGSGNLYDYAAARAFAFGMGDQPQIGSSMLTGPLQDIVAPTAEFFAGQAPQAVDMGFLGGGGGNINIPQISAGGGYKAPSIAPPDYSAILNNFNTQIGDIFKGMPGFFDYGQTPGPPPPGQGWANNPPAATPFPTATSPLAGKVVAAKSMADAAGLSLADFIQQNPKYLAKGGTVYPGETAVVGERGPEFLSNQGGTMQIQPIGGTQREPVPTAGQSFLGGGQATAQRGKTTVTTPDGTTVTTERPTGTTLGATNPPVGGTDSGGFLDFINTLPSTQAVNTGKPFLPLGNYFPDFFSNPGAGVKALANPYKAAPAFFKLPGPLQQDYLQSVKSTTGIPEELTQWFMAQTLPGYRNNPMAALSF